MVKDKQDVDGLVGVSIRLPQSLLAEIDRMASEARRTRSNMLRLLVEDALKAAKGKGK
jgi:metal-responsive CopG/Arc/MetJ family transcriptional regulator